MKILAIESSCDETAAAVLDGSDQNLEILSNIVASQIDIHKKYGGVVPEVAARAHIEQIIPVIQEALVQANISEKELDRIAVTFGPGLVGSLVVGVETAKALALSWKKPLFPINHLEGHIYANFIGKSSQIKNRNSEFETQNSSNPQFPLVTLLVSGGHTLIIYMKDHLNYEIIGHTLDDAAGEAFDKGARILGLPYPGGPEIAKLAVKGDENNHLLPVIDLTPEPKRNEEGFLVKQETSLDFSFSGLKTALLTKSKTIKLTPKTRSDLAASYQKAIVDTLIQNSLRAIEKYQPKTFILSGGVAANQKLRQNLERAVKENFPNTLYLIPSNYLCTDNAAMIGAACFFRQDKQANSLFEPEPNLMLRSFS